MRRRLFVTHHLSLFTAVKASLPTICPAALHGIIRLLCEQRLDLFHDLTRSWIPKTIRVNDFSIININTELTKAAPYNFYLSVIFFSQLGRHTGGHGLLDGSNRAVMYCDFLHRLRSFFGNDC